MQIYILVKGNNQLIIIMNTLISACGSEIFFLSQKQPQNLNLLYKMNLDVWNYFKREKK